LTELGPHSPDANNQSGIPFWVAAIPLVLLVGLLVANVGFFADSTGGPNQIALLASAAVAALLARMFGVSYQDAISGITSSIQAAIPAILILLVIGALSGTWMLSGIVPAMIYYGLQILDPSYFLFATVVIGYRKFLVDDRDGWCSAVGDWQCLRCFGRDDCRRDYLGRLLWR